MPTNISAIKPFSEPRHRPFLFANNHHSPNGRPGALLVHGFPGTPAEMRPLGNWLQAQGWAAKGVLLPGFGPDIFSLFDPDHPPRYADWVAAVRNEVETMRNQYQPLLLVGYSLGGAIALNVAAELTAGQADLRGLVLLAPFWRLGTWQQRLIFTLLRPFARGMKPLKKADFSDPDLQENIANFMPGLDLDDPAVQDMLRDFRVPAGLITQIDGVGKSARQRSPQVSLPTLIVQGSEDDLVTPDRTRELLQDLTGPLSYHELPAGHQLLDPDHETWPLLTTRLEQFIGQIYQPS
jgi:carboxylesterase